MHEKLGWGSEGSNCRLSSKCDRIGKHWPCYLASVCPKAGSIRRPRSSPAYKPTTYEGVDRSPYLLRGNRRRPGRADQVEKETLRKDPSESSDDESAPNLPDTPSPAERRAHGEGLGTRRSQRILAQRPRGGGEQDRKYCTQKCLLGLVRGGFLNLECPNVVLHRRQDGCDD
ncbi:hypothetical protein BKA56DRAFT_195039 [Ilyonectria sp. MPI-CAGE-AT-0026]|nr:hypothetical protein BKA56DRAFT_195039 [Ilyonectria sp. MPI-CAGE-AT-0026]